MPVNEKPRLLYLQNKIITMVLQSFPFQLMDWSSIAKEEHAGITGIAYWQVFLINDIRIRMVEYSAGYLADHWCNKDILFIALQATWKLNYRMAENICLHRV